MTNGRLLKLLAAAGGVALAGCVAGADAGTPDAGEAAASPSATVDATRLEALAPAAANIRFTIAPEGNSARYRVREQLMGRDRENDAVGETTQISGAITVDERGAVVPAESRIVVQTAAFKSDSDRRDGYVRRRLLQADSFPTVELAPTAARGLPATLPAAGTTAGPLTFELVGNLTVRGVTRPTTWQVTAQQAGNRVTGTATTRFAFADFQIDKPRVASVLSVADSIALEYDFTLLRSDAPTP